MKLINHKGKKLEIQFSNKEALTLRKALNEICSGIRINNFKEKIGVNKEEVEILFEAMSQAVEKQIAQTIKYKVGTRSSKILKQLNYSSVKKPLLTQIRQESFIKLNKYIIFFLLFTLKNTTGWCGIQIIIVDSKNSEQIIRKSIVQKISTSQLAWLIASLEEYMEQLKQKNEIELEKFSFYNWNRKHMFDLEFLSGNPIFQTLDICWKINVIDQTEQKNINSYVDDKSPIQKKIETKSTYLEIRDSVDFDNILNFTSEIYKFLSKFFIAASENTTS